MRHGSTDLSCLDWCCADSFRKFIRDGVLCANSGYDAVFVLRLMTDNEAGVSIYFAEICVFQNLMSEPHPKRMVTHLCGRLAANVQTTILHIYCFARSLRKARSKFYMGDAKDT